MKAYLRKVIVKILELEARAVLKKYKPKIVAVTGNVGKTSTKDAVFTVLSKFFYVRKSEKSFNSEIGIPLTILGRENAWNNPLLWFQNIVHGFVLIFSKKSQSKPISGKVTSLLGHSKTSTQKFMATRLVDRHLVGNLNLAHRSSSIHFSQTSSTTGQ